MRSYDGAKILSVPGLYQKPVICTDFSSLYPSCIIAHNIVIRPWMVRLVINYLPHVFRGAAGSEESEN